MKKIILTLAAMTLAAGMSFAQDLKNATDTYNAGAEMLGLGDKNAALEKFKAALAEAEQCGEDGAELVGNCKQAIPSVILSIGKELFNNKDFDGAEARFNEAAEVAKNYGNAEVADEVKELLPTLIPAKGKAAFDAKDFAKAAELYKAAVATDSTDGPSTLRLIQSLVGTGDIAGAKNYIALAESNGQADNAKKVVSSAILKKASAALKGGKVADAVAAAVESTEVLETPNAFLIAGQGSQKLGKKAEALKYFEKYLELAPKAKNSGAIALTVGALYQGMANKSKAIEYYKMAQTLGQDTKAYIDALSK